MASTTREKGNKSSIVRIIISNFDDRQIKELKVLYHKQGGVDTIQIDQMAFENEHTEAFGQLIFKTIKAVKLGSLEDKVMHYRTPSLELIDEPNGGNGIIATKYASHDQDSQIPEHILRKYKITGSWRYVSNVTDDKEDNRQKEITVSLEDIRNITTEADRLGRREKKTSTSRVLLSKETVQSYKYVLSSDGKEIDSRNIYKMNRFLEYRSGLLFYYTFINHFMVAPVRERYNEVWQIEKDYKNQEENIDEVIDKINDYLFLRVNDFIGNHNQYVDKLKLKLKNDEEALLNLKYGNEKRALEARIKRQKENMPTVIEDYKKVDLRVDLIKIIKIFSDLRHKLAHFEYDYFDRLFTGNGKDNEALIELLDLKLFKVMNHYVKVKQTYTAMYLDGNEKFHILDVTKDLKKTYELYQMICESKNGFNGFINTLLVQDGIENSAVKAIIEKDYHERIDVLKKLKGKEKESQTLEEWLLESDGEVYYQDIQLNPKYKYLYNKHKSAVERMNTLLVRPRDNKIKAEITEQNKEIKCLKDKMESITKRNSMYRLEYKLRIAFGYLQDVFRMDMRQFKNEFNLDSEQFQEKWGLINTDENRAACVKKWLAVKVPKISKGKNQESEFNFGTIKNQINAVRKLDENIFESNNRNVLFKLYALIHLFLPREIKGDFLGFVKHHYYDLKNVDFQFIGEEDNTPETSKDQFFHHMRLFEKGARRYDLFHYEVKDILQSKISKATDAPVDPFYYRRIVKNLLKADYLTDEVIDDMKLIGLIVRPIMKTYENIFHLATHIELRVLIKIAQEKGLKSVAESIEAVKEEQERVSKNKKNEIHYNFNCCLKYAKTGDLSKKSYYKIRSGIRNTILHLDPKEWFENQFSVTNTDENSSVQREVMNLFLISERLKLDQILIGGDSYNDYLMRYDQILFSLKKSSILSKPKGKTLIEQRENQQDRDQDKRKIETILNSYNDLKKAFEQEGWDLALKSGDISNLPEAICESKIDVKNAKGKTFPKRIGSMSKAEIIDYEYQINRTFQSTISDERGRFLHKINFEVKSELTRILDVDRVIMINVHVQSAHKASDGDIRICNNHKPTLERYFFLNSIKYLLGNNKLVLINFNGLYENELTVIYDYKDKNQEEIRINERSYEIDTNQKSSFKMRYIKVVE
ncbi:type VI-C CRISPR-associated RNA-guided ribonuclease Cas13c [Fusibacter ferrireducens]|uniref:Type VI-C CRISPR-associated RNA-guided ribonuclease Cas13c n=1 Tax=Fusibacter ferrireducens TaxID=2785058 RepID=A0ABR9ZRN3_9FIRM|nr:type VI-C CRISPR-associated RNA-guided ribonuclease Cas13c [Fusibacter ferrireducens]MBF4693118.1 type VI-C CRISPR-associated RNA-guided ribonuclease Cas13c [Fusibacter ferrireducens]